MSKEIHIKVKPEQPAPVAVTVIVPEGYELASNEPRIPVKGEFYIAGVHSQVFKGLVQCSDSEYPGNATIIGCRRFIVKRVWTPKLGEVVQVRDGKGEWATRVFIKFIQKYNQTRALVFDWVINFDQVGCENNSNTFSAWEQIRPLQPKL